MINYSKITSSVLSTTAGAGLYLAGFDVVFSLFGVASSKSTLLTLISIMSNAIACAVLSDAAISIVSNRFNFFNTRPSDASSKEVDDEHIIYAKQYFDRRRGLYYFQLTPEQQIKFETNPNLTIMPSC